MPRRILAWAVMLAVLGTGWWIWHYLEQLRGDPLPIDLPQVVVIVPGSSGRAVARQLEAQGVLADAAALIWTQRLWGRSALKAGEYEIPRGSSVLDLLRLLERGEVVQHAFTIVEGLTVGELRAGLQRDVDLHHTLVSVASADLLAALGVPAGHAEGRFLPDTYRFPRGTTDAQFLRRANTALERALAEAWAERAPDLPLRTAQQLLVLASVVERETGVANERAAIAGVFVRRLSKGMRLQSDPTVIYGMGERFNGNLRKQDLMTDTPYNTYTRGGLPPTPICLPSRAALRAAARPLPGDALYFVATGDGGHEFSVTLAQHNAAVRRYLQRLRQQRKESAP